MFLFHQIFHLSSGFFRVAFGVSDEHFDRWAISTSCTKHAQSQLDPVEDFLPEGGKWAAEGQQAPKGTRLYGQLGFNSLQEFSSPVYPRLLRCGSYQLHGSFPRANEIIHFQRQHCYPVVERRDKICPTGIAGHSRKGLNITRFNNM